MSRKSVYKYIIWDWNGTLYDDVLAGVDTINSMLIERSISPLSVDRYKEIFGFPIIDYYKRAGFDFEKEPYEKLAAIFIERNNLRLGESALFPDVIDVLRNIKKMRVNQLILSATRKDILREQIGLFNIEDYFIDLLGNEDFYAYGKAGHAKLWIEQHGVDSRNILLIGDTIHDYEVAATVGCDCFLVCRGHQSHKTLSSTNAKILCDLSEVLKHI